MISESLVTQIFLQVLPTDQKQLYNGYESYFKRVKKIYSIKLSKAIFWYFSSLFEILKVKLYQCGISEEKLITC